jgi:hydroxymethylpyrimidine pyrophosphatase-like HAD family hydrolase
MWIVENDKLKHTTDESRDFFATTISKGITKRLKETANNNDTFINYLLEEGLNKVLSCGTIVYDKKSRPKDRVLFKTTFDKELIKEFRKFAKEHNLCANDVIEYSIQFIDLSNVKNGEHRYRIEY